MKILSAVVLVVVIVGAVVKERAHIVEYFKLVGLAALCFNLASMAVGYLTPLLVKLPRKQAIAIGMEIGIHNGTLAIAIATAPTLLNNSTMSIPPAIYSLIMFFTAAAFGTFVSRRLRGPAAARDVSMSVTAGAEPSSPPLNKVE